MASTNNQSDLPLIQSPNNQQKKDSNFNNMEKRLSDKFEEFSAKRTAPKAPARDRPTEILEVNDVSPILHMIEERIRKIEVTYGKKAGYFLCLFCAFILAFACIASEVYMPKLPAIEVLFVAFLVAFLFNYYLIRDGEVLPYIETESDNFLAKVSGISGFASIIFFIYSFQKCELQTTLFCFGSSWIFYILIESCSKNTQNRLNRNQLICGLLMIVSTFIILSPNFSPEIDMASEPAAPENTTETATENAENTESSPESTHFYGVISAFASGIFFGYMNLCIRQLKNYNFITITHIFTYIQAPFIPVFFPLQKLVSPTLAQWVFMIGLGLIFVFILQIYIRSCQLENTTKSLLAVPQFVAFLILFSIVFGVSAFGVHNIFSIIFSLAILGLSYKFALEINSEIPQVQTQSNQNQEIPLQTFSQNDSSNLNQKLLDEQH